MANRNLTIGFVGGGHMAHAIICGLIRAGHAAERLCVADPDPQQRERILTAGAQIRITGDNDTAVANADVVVLAVKPQIMGSVIAALATPAAGQSPVFVSIAAGITIDTLQRLLGNGHAIVRIMPNQPALVGAGMSVLVATPATSDAQRNQAQYVAGAAGDTAWIDDEALMDAVTAVSGSGPAYFYLFMEIIEACARDMGLPADLARQLARQTGYGAGRVVAESDLELDALRASVTSKGGTTAAAIGVLENPEFRAIVARALLAARDRSIELGKTS